jgi:TM2 domain-containing membrane protein YozV
MDAQKVDMYLMTNAKYFQAQHLNYIREKLLAADDSKWMMIHSVELKDPTTILIISIIVGHLGIDRFLLGDTGLGVVKLITCGGLGVWTIVDWFLVMDLARQKNMEKLQTFL